MLLLEYNHHTNFQWYLSLIHASMSYSKHLSKPLIYEYNFTIFKLLFSNNSNYQTLPRAAFEIVACGLHDLFHNLISIREKDLKSYQKNNSFIAKVYTSAEVNLEWELPTPENIDYCIELYELFLNPILQWFESDKALNLEECLAEAEIKLLILRKSVSALLGIINEAIDHTSKHSLELNSGNLFYKNEYFQSIFDRCIQICLNIHSSSASLCKENIEVVIFF